MTSATDSKSTQRRSTKKRARRATWPWRVALVVAVVVSVVVGGDWVLHRSYFSVHTVKITGAVHESRATILRVAQLTGHPAMIDLSDALVEQRLRTLTWIDHTVVTKQWPSTLNIFVVERVPVAVVRAAHSQLWLVDKSDHPLQKVRESRAYPLLQVASGVNSPWTYARWASAAALVASQLPNAFQRQVTAVIVTRAGSITLQLTTPISFVLGPADQLVAKFAAIAAVIHASAVNNVTLRAGDVVDVTVPGTLTVSGP